MGTFRSGTALLGFLLLMSGAAGANQENKKTVFTFHDSVQVPGMVLEPGVYIFKLAGSDSDRNIVQIYNQDQSKLITTVLAVPNSRLQPSGKTIITYAQPPANKPPALEAWFSPGETYGQQFVYPNSVANELSKLNTIKVPSTSSEEAYPEPQIASQSDSRIANNPKLATTSYEPQTADPSTQADRSQEESSGPKGDTASANLPQTASDLPLLGLVGLMSIGAVLILRKMIHTLF